MVENSSIEIKAHRLLCEESGVSWMLRLCEEEKLMATVEGFF